MNRNSPKTHEVVATMMQRRNNTCKRPLMVAKECIERKRDLEFLKNIWICDEIQYRGKLCIEVFSQEDQVLCEVDKVIPFMEYRHTVKKEMRTDETQGDQGVFSIREKNQRYVSATCIEKHGLYTETDSHGSRITNKTLIKDFGNEMRTDETQGDQGVFSIIEENQRYVSATCSGEHGLYTEKDSHGSRTTNETLIEDLGNEMRTDETQGNQGVFSIREENQRYVSATYYREPGLYTETDSHGSRTTNETLIEDLGNEMSTDETQGNQGVFSIREENQRYVSATCTGEHGLYTQKDIHGSRTTNETLIGDLGNEMRTDETQGDQDVFSISEDIQRDVSATCIGMSKFYTEKDSHGSRITNETLHSKSIGFVSTRKYCIYDEVNAFCYAKRIDYMPVYDDYEGIFRIYLFSSKKALQTIEFIERRNLNAVFVNFV